MQPGAGLMNTGRNGMRPYPLEDETWRVFRARLHRVAFLVNEKIDRDHEDEKGPWWLSNG